MGVFRVYGLYRWGDQWFWRLRTDPNMDKVYCTDAAGNGIYRQDGDTLTQLDASFKSDESISVTRIGISNFFYGKKKPGV